MAYFGAGYGGNAGGGPDGFRWTWTTPGEHRGAGGRRVRGVTQNLDADAALAANHGQKLSINFEMGGEGTWQAVGENAGVWANLIGARVRNTIPFYFATWEHVPPYYLDEILEYVRRYFELGPYLNRREHDDVRMNMLAGFKVDCKKKYRNSKSRFKALWYLKPLEEDGLSLDQLRQLPPPGMPEDMWNDHVDFFSGVRRQRQAEINAQNRQQMPYIARQGRINQARRRHAILEATGHYPPKIEHWVDLHVDGQGNYISELVPVRPFQLKWTAILFS